MLYSQSPPLADNETAEENSPRGSAREQETRSEPRFGRRPTIASIHSLSPPRPRPSIGRRMFRAVTRFVIVVLIGVGGTLGWQAYGDMAKEMLAARAPEQAWLLSYLPATNPPAAVAANPALQLEPLVSNLEFVRRSVEQLALKQEQMARNIAGDRYSIGYSGLAYTDAPVKMVPLVEKEGDAPQAPTYENVALATYPLSRLIYLNTNKAPGKPLNPVMEEFLRFVLSREGQQVVLEHARYIPLRAWQANAARALLSDGN